MVLGTVVWIRWVFLSLTLSRMDRLVVRRLRIGLCGALQEPLVKSVYLSKLFVRFRVMNLLGDMKKHLWLRCLFGCGEWAAVDMDS